MDQGSPKATVFVRDKKNLQQAAEYALLLETLGWGVKGVSVDVTKDESAAQFFFYTRSQSWS